MRGMQLVACLLKIYQNAVSESGELILPRQLALNSSHVTCSGDPEKLQSLCSDIAELDLADNELKDWVQVCIKKQS